MNGGRIENEVLRDTLHFIAQQGWTETGKSYLESLVEYLAKALDMEYVFVDELLPSGTQARTIAFYAHGQAVHNVEYDLVNTPCDNVMNKRLCSYPRNVPALFPQDELLVKMEVEAYMGLPMWDSKGAPIGLIAIMSTRPFVDEEAFKNVLQVVALRTAHEIERRRDAQELSHHYDRLEDMVRERTRDLQAGMDRLAIANAEIKHMNEKLNIMSGITYHDITNQVMIMRGALDLIKNYPVDENVANLLAMVNRSAEIVARTMDMARDYERAGVTAPAWQNVALLIKRLSAPKVVMSPELSHLSLYADPLLSKVFYNLMDNSEKHGGKVTRINVSTMLGKEELRLVWDDDGNGVPADRKAAIFERDPRKTRVHGLFLIREILQITGIRIEETGIPGKGARFEMVVPSSAYRFEQQA